MEPAPPDMNALRDMIRRLESLVAHARTDLATAELVLLSAKAEFCRCPPLAPPEAPHAD